MHPQQSSLNRKLSTVCRYCYCLVACQRQGEHKRSAKKLCQDNTKLSKSYVSSDLEHRSKRIKEPPMAVNFFLVFLLHAKYDLGWHDALVRVFEVEIRVECERGRVFKQMGCHFLLVDSVFHVISWLIDA